MMPSTLKQMVDRRFRCTECDWTGPWDKFDQVTDPHPKGTVASMWLVCPKCRTPENNEVMCDEPGCEQRGSCGTPDNMGGYVWTCYEHRPTKE